VITGFVLGTSTDRDCVVGLIFAIATFGRDPCDDELEELELDELEDGSSNVITIAFS
jgi:hypothetical protein